MSTDGNNTGGTNKIEGKATKPLLFVDGIWCREIKDEKNKVYREKITGATFEETVYFMFRVKNYYTDKSKFEATIKSYKVDTINEKVTTDKIKKIDKFLYIEDEKVKEEKSSEEYHVFEFEVKLEKNKYQKSEADLVLCVYLETTAGSANQGKGTLPKDEKNYLNVYLQIKFVKLRVLVLDGVKGIPMRKEKVASISIDATSLANLKSASDLKSKITDFKSNILKVYFNGWEGQTGKNTDSNDVKYSCESVQRALNGFYGYTVLSEKEEYQNDESFDAMKRLYDCGDVSTEFSTVNQKGAYNKYLESRGYAAVKRLETKDKIPPLNVRKLIVDEYNGMCMTDDDGYLYIPIPVDKFLDNKEVKISIEFRSYYSFFEKIKKNQDLIEIVKPVQRGSSWGSPKSGDTGFKFFNSSDPPASLKSIKGAAQLLNKISSKNLWVVNHDKEVAIIKNKPSTIINTRKEMIYDYNEIDSTDKFVDDFSVFFKKSKDKNSGKRWADSNYPLNKPKGEPHLVMFLMTHWDTKEQGKSWIDTLNEIKDDKKKPELKNYLQDYDLPKLDDGKIHIIAIRKGSKGDNRPNDIIVVVKGGKLEGVFYGSTKPGNASQTEMLRGQYTNYTVAIIWDWKYKKDKHLNSNAPVLKQNPDLGKWTPTDPPSEYREDDWAASRKSEPGNPNIFIHYGARGFQKVGNSWVWYKVGGISTGCQIICGSHNIKSDGKLFMVGDLNELSVFENVNRAKGNLGVYENFYTIYITKGAVWETGYEKNNMRGIKPNEPVVYTLINETDLKGTGGEKFYYLYRKNLFFKA